MSFIHRFVKGEGPGTLLLLHGTGGDESDLLAMGRDLAPRAHLLSPRGKVLEQGMPRFFRRLRPGVFDLEDLLVRSVELAGFVRESAVEYGFDAGRVIALGYSNGANIGASLLYKVPGLLAGALLLRPMDPWPGEQAVGLYGVRPFRSGFVPERISQKVQACPVFSQIHDSRLVPVDLQLELSFQA